MAHVRMAHVADTAWIPRVLRFIRTSTQPGKITPEHLLANGFGPESPHLVGFLTMLGFIDARRQPTAAWTMYKVSDSADADLRELIRRAYAPLYEAFNNPHRQGAGVLEALVGEATGYQELARRQTVATFRSLCASANLKTPDGEAQESKSNESRQSHVVIQEMAGLLATANFELETAHTCLAAGAFRPAHVSAWNGYVALALMRLAADDFAAVRAVRPRWRAQTVFDLAAQTPGRTLLDLLVEAELLTADEEVHVAQLLQRRNDAAHPTPFRPSQDEAERYIDAVLTCAERLRQLTLV